ncbi:sugar-binding domain-containing protein [Mangrovimonas xylaniphaga]|uniref:sugar-binding domain-containing protein n=1 Tax=Mangrovimonas xylaniphaga TaxID=1645915 RepID=UPI0009E88AA3|nr:sugar-binding domain-containing protein [Mangrovimonas xylaniphaga]
MIDERVNVIGKRFQAFKNIMVLLMVFCQAAVMVAQVSFGQSEKLKEGWKFTLKDATENATNDFDDSHWQTISVPHDWSVKGQLSPTLASATGYLPGGAGWYRKHLEIPLDKKGEKVYLYFEGVYNRSEVFINGHSLGKRPNGYVSFMYDATPFIKYGGDNVIAVRVDHSQSADSRWYTGSGIYRDAWLVYANPVHVSQWGVYAYPEKLNSGYRLNVEVDLENGLGTSQSLIVENQLFDSKNNLVAKSTGKLKVQPNQTEKLTTSLKVKRPNLWSVDTPNLYTLKTIVYSNGKVVDESLTKTGFRDFTFDSNKGFALNGNWMKVKGVCLHHDGGVLGAAVPKAVWKRRLLTLKEIGVNAIRTSHNPQAPDLYNLCDELGLLVLNEAFDEWEFPKRKWLKGWNKGEPGFQGSYDFFKEWGERDLADMVKRDRNHVSVFAWSIGNEVDYPNDPYSHPVLDGGRDTGFTQPIFGGYRKDAPDAKRLGAIAQQLVKVVKEYDPSRPTTAGLAGVAMSNQTEYPFALDIAGYNYTESLYDHDHAEYPNRVLYGSENRHDFLAWKEVTSRDFVFGQFLWTGIDYLGESGAWPSRGFYSGLLDFGGFIKPRGYFRQSLWSDRPMAYLGTYPSPGNRERSPSMDAWSVWNYEEGQMIRVVCYTNAAQAELHLNGKIVGERKTYNNETGIIFWDVPFQKGTLEVLGLDNNGNQVSQYRVQSSSRPDAIKLISGEGNYKKGELAQLVVQVVDKNGIPVMLSDEELTCQITGDAKLLGLEASNNSDMSDYTDNKHRVYHGRLIAYVQLGNTNGDVVVKFSSPWLQSGEARISVQ